VKAPKPTDNSIINSLGSPTTQISMKNESGLIKEKKQE
jgi:hypothetical protein